MKDSIMSNDKQKYQYLKSVREICSGPYWREQPGQQHGREKGDRGVGAPQNKSETKGSDSLIVKASFPKGLVWRMVPQGKRWVCISYVNCRLSPTVGQRSQLLSVDMGR